MNIVEFLSLSKAELERYIETRKDKLLYSGGGFHASAKQRKALDISVYLGKKIVKGLRLSANLGLDVFMCTPVDPDNIFFSICCSSWKEVTSSGWMNYPIALQFQYINGEIVNCSGRLDKNFPVAQFSEPREYIQLRYGLDNCW